MQLVGWQQRKKLVRLLRVLDAEPSIVIVGPDDDQRALFLRLALLVEVPMELVEQRVRVRVDRDHGHRIDQVTVGRGPSAPYASDRIRLAAREPGASTLPRGPNADPPSYWWRPLPDRDLSARVPFW